MGCQHIDYDDYFNECLDCGTQDLLPAGLSDAEDVSFLLNLYFQSDDDSPEQDYAVQYLEELVENVKNVLGAA